MADKTLFYALCILLRAEFLGHRRDLGPSEPTWDDSIEIREIGINVQCQTMVGNAAPHGEANSGNFSIFDPDAAYKVVDGC